MWYSSARLTGTASLVFEHRTTLTVTAVDERATAETECTGKRSGIWDLGYDRSLSLFSATRVYNEKHLEQDEILHRKQRAAGYRESFHRT